MNAENEIWKNINDRILVSNFGNVKYLAYTSSNGQMHKERITKGCTMKNGYKTIGIGRTMRLYVHKLVWEAFNGNVPKGYHIHHIDSDKTNNSLNNLTILTESEHHTMHGKNRIFSEESRRKIGDSQLNRKDKSKTIYQYTKDYQLIAIYPSSREAERQTGFAGNHIRDCANPNCILKTFKSFIWSHFPINNDKIG